MKSNIAILILSLFFAIQASAQFTDDFSDGNFTNNPAWFGMDSDFEVLGQELHLNAPAVSSISYLSTNSMVINTATWIFKVRMDFNPSASNFARVYLMSDNSALNGSLEGYFVEIGGSDDEISLYRQDGSNDTEIIDGTDDAVDTTDVNVRVKVERDATGNWTLSYDLTGGINYTQDGASVLDNTYNVSLYAGVFCDYTSTRSDKFYFDDFSVSGQVYQDNTPPEINSVTVASSTELVLKFSENIEKSSGEDPNNYSVNNAIGSPSAVSFNSSDSSKITLTFGSSFPNGQINTLSISNLEDNMGNVMSNTDRDFVYFIPVPASARDIVINEIFADPTPQIGLPAGEFIELYNASNNVFDLNGWSISDGGSNKTLSSHILVPGEHVILCAEDDTFSYKFFGDVIGISWNTLTNGGDDIYLYDSTQNLIDEVHYDLSWYGDDDKEDGGYSLELINPEHPCQNSGNWTASNNNNGGSPGSQNSVYDNSPDTDGPTIEKVNLISNNEIEVIFSESMDSNSVANASYNANNGLNVLYVSTSGPYYNSVNLSFTTAFQNGIIYTIEVNSANDCSGNSMASPNTGKFILPDTATGNEIIINEVLFDPVSTGSDYVELYNNSNKYIDLKDWKIATLDDQNTISSDYVLSTSTNVLYPQSFALISKNSQNILDQYPYTNDSNYIELSSMPSYNNEEGIVIILNPLDTIMDRFDYNKDLHFELLDSYDGVALERLDYDRDTQDPTNWISGAENVGFGTPGYKNSQTQVINFTGDKIQIEPEVFSPDNDGFQDVVNISYELEEEGMVGNISIYDDKGNLVKNLVENELMGKTGTYSWDGTNIIGEKSRIGIHIIFIEVFDLHGSVEAFKKTCVVSHKL